MKDMSRFEKARLFAIMLAIIFYVTAKIGGIIPLSDYIGSVASAVMPVVFNIYATITEVAYYDSYAAYLVLQIACLGLAWLSVLTAYITNALCKWEYKLGNS